MLTDEILTFNFVLKYVIFYHSKICWMRDWHSETSPDMFIAYAQQQWFSFVFILKYVKKKKN